MSSNLEQEIGRKVQALSDAEQQRLLNIIDDLLGEGQAARPSIAPPIWEIFEQLSQQIPIEEWSKLPSDGAEQHDHYLYGAPKRNNP
jgi:predicted KAP-like P-loop ATPase